MAENSNQSHIDPKMKHVDPQALRHPMPVSHQSMLTKC